MYPDVLKAQFAAGLTTGQIKGERQQKKSTLSARNNSRQCSPRAPSFQATSAGVPGEGQAGSIEKRLRPSSLRGPRGRPGSGSARASRDPHPRPGRARTATRACAREQPLAASGRCASALASPPRTLPRPQPAGAGRGLRTAGLSAPLPEEHSPSSWLRGPVHAPALAAGVRHSPEYQGPGVRNRSSHGEGPCARGPAAPQPPSVRLRGSHRRAPVTSAIQTARQWRGRAAGIGLVPPPARAAGKAAPGGGGGNPRMRQPLRAGPLFLAAPRLGSQVCCGAACRASAVLRYGSGDEVQKGGILAQSVGDAFDFKPY